MEKSASTDRNIAAGRLLRFGRSDVSLFSQVHTLLKDLKLLPIHHKPHIRAEGQEVVALRSVLDQVKVFL